jgi:hypothetical protein
MAGRHRARTRAGGLIIGTAGAGLILNGSTHVAMWGLSILVGLVVVGTIAITAGVLFSGRSDPANRLAHLMHHARKPDLCLLCLQQTNGLDASGEMQHSGFPPVGNEKPAVVPQIHQKRRLHPNG